MEKYTFKITGRGVNRKVTIYYEFADFMFDYWEIGDIYNAIDYIKDNSWDHSEINFIGFTNEERNLINREISRYKKVETISSPTIVIISDKKKRVRR